VEMNSKMNLEWKQAFSENGGEEMKGKKGKKEGRVSLAVVVFELMVAKLAHSKTQVDS
jgi:hypothetical protein